jgi:hypothetical protein
MTELSRSGSERDEVEGETRHADNGTVGQEPSACPEFAKDAPDDPLQNRMKDNFDGVIQWHCLKTSALG